MNELTPFVDSRGKPIEKSVCGPFFGIGELGGIYELGPLEDGFQRNLTLAGQKACPALFAAINVYAQTIGTLRMQHFSLVNNGREPITTSALYRILYQPNDYQQWSDFTYNFVFSLLSTGNAYAFAIRNDRGEVNSLHLMASNGTQPYVDRETGLVYYGLGNNPMLDDLTMMVPARDVLHVRVYTPSHPLVGVTPIKYATAATSINNAISRNQSAFFNNMSRPSGVLSTDEKLTKEQMDALRKAWYEKSRGLATGEVPVLSWGLKWQSLTITSEDAQLIEAYRMSVEDIARVFNIPLMLIGDYTRATYNNSEALMRHWLASGLGFMLEHIERSFAKFFRLPQTEIVNFDVTGLLRTDFEKRINGLTKGIMGGLYSPNEARAQEGLPAVEFGDEPRVQAQNVPLSSVGNMPSATNTPPTPPTPAQEGKTVKASHRDCIGYLRTRKAA